MLVSTMQRVRKPKLCYHARGKLSLVVKRLENPRFLPQIAEKQALNFTHFTQGENAV
jgi:hypothetical protein